MASTGARTRAGRLDGSPTTGTHQVPHSNQPTVIRTFEDFYRTDRDRLVRMLAFDLGDVEVAAEAVDVAMSRAWERWSRLDAHHDAGAWVYRVARNWAMSWFRGRRRISSGPVPEQAVAPGEQAAPMDLRRALDQLSEEHRAVVVLRVHGGYSTAATAAALDVPEGTVKSRLARALDQLRATLEDPR